MNTLQKRFLSAVAVLVVAAVAAYWYWSPYLAVRQLREAAAASDAGRFNEHVDFPRLRESLKEQLSARMNGEIGNRSGSNFGSMLALALVDKLIDAAVRPETVMFAMREGKFKVENSGPQDGQREEGEHKKVAWRTERQGFDTILFRAEGDGSDPHKEKVTLVMHREGFANWKLTDIRLPD